MKNNKIMPIEIIKIPAVPAEKAPKLSCRQVTPITRPPPMSADSQLGSESTLSPVYRKEKAPKVARIFHNIFEQYYFLNELSRWL